MRRIVHDRRVNRPDAALVDPPVIGIPDGSLVVLVGPSGAGKSTFARRHFRPTEVLSSDAFRAMLTDDEGDQTVSRQAFALLHHVALERLRRHRTTVIDATSVQPSARRALLALRGSVRCRAVAIVFDVPLRACLERNALRADRVVGPDVVARQATTLERTLRTGVLAGEGFDAIFVLAGTMAVDRASIVRTAR